MLLYDLHLEAYVDDVCCLAHTCIGDLLCVLTKNYGSYQSKEVIESYCLAHLSELRSDTMFPRC